MELAAFFSIVMALNLENVAQVMAGVEMMLLIVVQAVIQSVDFVVSTVRQATAPPLAHLKPPLLPHN